MPYRNQFQLDALVFTFILLFFFCIVSAGFLIGVLVQTVSLPAEIVNALPVLAFAFLALAVGGALTAILYWSIQVAPQVPVQTLRRNLLVHTIKRSSRMDHGSLN